LPAAYYDVKLRPTFVKNTFKYGLYCRRGTPSALLLFAAGARLHRGGLLLEKLLLRCSLVFVIPTASYAISAQWDLDPISENWHTAANWTPDGIPNGPTDTATFGLSNTTDVSITDDGTEVNGITFTAAATNPYVITVRGLSVFVLSGTGIANNSGITHRFELLSDEKGVAEMRFTNSASAGNARIDGVGFMDFHDGSTAGSATMIISGAAFLNDSTAGSASIRAEGANTSIGFLNHSSAGSASIELSGDGGFNSNISFSESSTASSATLAVQGGSIHFRNGATAANSTISAVGEFAKVFFDEGSQGNRAAITLVGDPLAGHSILDISGHDAPGVGIGSLSGQDASVFLGTNNLTVGRNNLSTTFSGMILCVSSGMTGLRKDPGVGNLGCSRPAGSLAKVGSGTFSLEGRGENDYLENPVGLVLISQAGPINLNFTGQPDVIGSLVVDGVPQPQGIYGSPDSGAPNPLPEFAGLGTVAVSDGPTPTATPTVTPKAGRR
jgi:hypothetical protein